MVIFRTLAFHSVIEGDDEIALSYLASGESG